jgi:LmbE family N-acetylglucosaminyl deacetylase
MHRREFMDLSLASTLLWEESSPAAIAQKEIDPPGKTAVEEMVIEKDLPGQPHAGKVLAVIEPHADDTSIFCSGTVAKLIHEGYTGYLIRTSNDEKCGPGTAGEAVLGNERDSKNIARILGLKKVFFFGYRNHRLDGISPLEIRGRLIFLFRVLKVDTVVSFDPWGHYEENPDHSITAQAVESACWMAGMDKDYPEHFEAGITPHSVKERYYYARGPQQINRLVDIGSYIDKKIEVNIANKTQGPAGDAGARLRAKLASQNLRLPILGEDDETANYQYVKHFLLKDNEEIGKKYGLLYAEAFHYVGQRVSGSNALNEYIKKNAVPLK